jgi:DNA replication complex GINS protein SLD5 C-terminus
LNAATPAAAAAATSQMVTEPDLDVYVVCRVMEDVGSVEVSAQQGLQLELMKGDEYVLRYRPVREFVLNGQIQLI